MKAARKSEGEGARGNHRHAFTLIELLLVILVIALLAALLLPALSSAKANSQQAACLGNLRQLEAAFQMYANDNRGYLAQNISFALQLGPEIGTNAWVYGNMKVTEDSTNSNLIKLGELYPYIPQTKSYHCPADFSTYNGIPRVRSYAMNSWIGSKEMETYEIQTPYRIYLKDSDLAAGKPSAIFVHIDEHAYTLEDGWFEVTMNDMTPFANLTGTRHQNAYGLNFADGHAEAYRLRTTQAQIPETEAQAFTPVPQLGIPPNNADWIKLKQVTTSP